jgi:hypothetical protein
MIDEQRSIINTLRNHAPQMAVSNGGALIPDSVFNQLNANYIALGIPGNDDQLRSIDDGASTQSAISADPLLSRGRRLSSNSDIRARSRSALRQMNAIQESPGEGHQA